eukprot:5862349-Amphidinium_carterae.1
MFFNVGSSNAFPLLVSVLSCNSNSRCVSIGSLEIIDLLLDARADVQSKDEEGRTALHIACYRGHEGAVRLMLGTALHRPFGCEQFLEP